MDVNHFRRHTVKAILTSKVFNTENVIFLAAIKSRQLKFLVKIPMTCLHLINILLCFSASWLCSKRCKHYSFKVCDSLEVFFILSFFQCYENWTFVQELNLSVCPFYDFFVLCFLWMLSSLVLNIDSTTFLLQFDNFKNLQAQWCFETVSLVLESFLATLLLERNKNRKTDYQ